MTVAGLDIGGTKIETRVFDDRWTEVARQRCATPPDYPDVIEAIGGQIDWARTVAGPLSAIGIGSAGLVHPKTGLALTANLSATGQPMLADITRRAGHQITLINDCRALALSEAVFGAGQGKRTVLALIIGTGVGGGIAVDRALHPGPTATGGEFGHIAAPAHIIAEHSLPILPCGCGRVGCYEAYMSGPGLERLAQHFTGQSIGAPDITARKDTDMGLVWSVWCQFSAELVHTLTLSVDPDIIVLGGGLSGVAGVADDIANAARSAQISGFDSVPIVIAQGGDASGARGAAYAAWQGQNHV